MGREKDGVESEVARLINESLEEEKSSKKVCFPKKKIGSFVTDSIEFNCVDLGFFFILLIFHKEGKWRRR